MNLGIVMYSNDPETLWNALRLGVFALKKQDQVSVFLLGKGVEVEQLESEAFNLREQLQAFVDEGGEILACGTCLQVRQQGASDVCPISSMADLYDMISRSDKLLTF